MDENRERVLDFIRTSEQAVSIRELTDALELSESCVFNKLRRLTMDGEIEQKGKRGKFYVYGIAGAGNRKDPALKGGITEPELEKARARVKIGDRLRVWDENTGCRESFGHGAAIVATVVKKYPHIVQLDNGHSVTYVQLAMYYRETGRGRCIR